MAYSRFLSNYIETKKINFRKIRYIEKKHKNGVSTTSDIFSMCSMYNGCNAMVEERRLSENSWLAKKKKGV